MSDKECGTCRYWLVLPFMNDVPIGTCELFPEHCDPHLPGGDATAFTHYRHVLSSTHPAPPCWEGRAKRVSAYGGIRSNVNKSDGFEFKGVAQDDIKKGEEVIIE